MEKRTLIYIAADSACYFFFFIVVVVMSERSLPNMPFMCIMRGTIIKRIIALQ